MTLSRRAVLGVAGVAAGAALLGACGERSSSTAAPRASPFPSGVRRVRYGSGRDQFADLYPAAETTASTLVLIHGGYWLPQYGLDLMEPLARRFAELGYHCWNIEYTRSSASRPGFPDTLTDVAAAIDHLAAERLDRDVVVLGHSAGGHLAAWAASRTAKTPGGAPEVRLSGVVSLSGVLDLSGAAAAPESRDPVLQLMGGTPGSVPERYAVADPTLLVPASCPVRAVQDDQEQVIPVDQSTTYVAAATAAGGSATKSTVEGDHFTLIDPSASSFAAIRGLVDGLASPDRDRSDS